MKAKTNDEVKGKLAKRETNGKFRNLTNDPTLEGKDENKVGRFQRKIAVPKKSTKNAIASTAGRR
jgi:hypothetical protein